MANFSIKKIFLRYLYVWLVFIILIIALGWYSHQKIQSYDTFVLSEDQEIIDRLDVMPRTALVFGTAITPEGIPRSVLQERLDTVIELYRNDTIDMIIVSGYNDTIHMDYNEPAAMRRYLLQNDIPGEVITADYYGDNTFQSCKQAATEFSTVQALLITQESHLNRAIFLCQHHGIEAYGYRAPSVPSRRIEGFQAIRELAANVKAIIETTVR